MDDLIGFASIFLVTSITLIIALRWPAIANILISALVIRIFLLLIGHYIINLPDSTSDSIGFEIKAWKLAQAGFLNLPSQFEFSPFVFFSWLHAIPYSLFGRSVLMSQSISLLFGIGFIFLTWRLANKLWNIQVANKVGWWLAFFPSIVLYSILFLREIYISFFLVVAVYGAVNWVKKDSLKSIFISSLGFVGAALFHGPMIVGFFILVIFIIIKYSKNIFKSLKYYRIKIKFFLVLFLCICILQLYIANKINIPYLGTFENLTDINRILKKISYAYMGGSSWPEWIKPTTANELFYIAPIRSIYFIFSPFPWDIRKVDHLIGLFDSLLFMYLFFLIIKNIKLIWKDPALKIILVILIFYIIVFGFGVGNFGTALRHRSKLAFMFVLLAIPKIKKNVFQKTK